MMILAFLLLRVKRVRKSHLTAAALPSCTQNFVHLIERDLLSKALDRARAEVTGLAAGERAFSYILLKFILLLVV